MTGHAELEKVLQPRHKFYQGQMTLKQVRVVILALDKSP